MSAGRLVRSALRFLTAILITRALGADGYGDYALGLTVITLVTEFCVLGFDNANVRFIPILQSAGKKLQLRNTVAFSLKIALLLAGVAGLGILLGRNFLAVRIFHDTRLAPVLVGLVIMVPLGTFLRVAFGVLRGLGRMQYQIYVENLLIPGSLMVLLSLVLLLGYRLWGVVASVGLVYL